VLAGLRSKAVHALMRSVLRPLASRGRLARGPLPSGRRLLLLHLDGLGRRQLDQALARGSLPSIARLLERSGYRVSDCRAGAPSSTPAFQAGLLYGATADIPGYSWFDKRRRRAVRMDSGADARALEADLAARGRPLLEGGSVYCSIFSGGARPRRWALSGIGEKLGLHDLAADPLRDPPELPGPLDVLAAALVHSATAGAIGMSLGLDAASAALETLAFVARAGSAQHESHFLLNRILTECLFPEFAANATVVDIARGTPIVYACFIGYDEYAHRRGPESRAALLKLWELDRALRRIFAAALAVPELGYELYLFSDHGQARTVPAERVLGESLAEHLLADFGGGAAQRVAQEARRLRELARSLPEPLSRAALGLARHKARALDASEPGAADGSLLVVPAGDLAHVYSADFPEPLDEAALRARHPGLIEHCAASAVVGLTLVRTKASAVAFARGKRLELSRPADALEASSIAGHPLAAQYAKDLLANRSAGDLVLAAAGAPCGQNVAYPWELGSHGGLSADELDTFVVHPASLGADAFAHVQRPAELHAFFEERAGRRARGGSAKPAAAASERGLA
jgi:hypothetical protein